MAAAAEAGVNPLPTEGDVAQIIVREATAADGPAILGPCSKDVYNGEWHCHGSSRSPCGTMAQGHVAVHRA